MKTREAFHELINEIEDEKVLKGYFQLVKGLYKNESGKLWESLSLVEKEDLIISYEESFDSANLISHDEVKKQHEKWLGK